MTLQGLKTLAEAVIKAAEDESWFPVDDLTNALRAADITVCARRDAEYIVALPPTTVLKLLEIIEVYRSALDELMDRGRPRLDAKYIAACKRNSADELERSL